MNVGKIVLPLISVLLSQLKPEHFRELMDKLLDFIEDSAKPFVPGWGFSA